MVVLRTEENGNDFEKQIKTYELNGFGFKVQGSKF